MDSKPLTEFEVQEAMGIYGGSFVQALAGAAHRADANNLQRLKDAFSEVWEEYREMAMLRRVHLANEGRL